MGAIIVAAFVDGERLVVLPGIERAIAIRAAILGFALKSWMALKETVADLAFDLLSLLTIVEIEILRRGVALWTVDLLGNFGFCLAEVDGL